MAQKIRWSVIGAGGIADRRTIPAIMKDEGSELVAVMDRVPEERWSRTHHSLIFHGRQCCDARKPKCDECPVNTLCEYVHGEK